MGTTGLLMHALVLFAIGVLSIKTVSTEHATQLIVARQHDHEFAASYSEDELKGISVMHGLLIEVGFAVGGIRRDMKQASMENG